MLVYTEHGCISGCRWEQECSEALPIMDAGIPLIEVNC